MTEEHRILILEDLPTDAELADRALKRELVECKTLRVETQDEFLTALESFAPDLIVSDYFMPGFDGMSALKLALAHNPDLPFIILTGSINEDTAVKCMKSGAWDYVLKENVRRLGLAAKSAFKKRDTLLERKKAEQALRQSELQQRTILNALPNLVALLDLKYNIIWANKLASEISESKLKELIGQKCYQIWGDGQSICKNCLTQEAILSGKEQSAIRESADQKIWKITCTPLKDEAGNIYNTLQVAEDITQSRSLEKKLQQAQKMEAIGTLAGGIAHDFNNILSVIIGYIELTFYYLDKSGSAYEHLKKVLQATTRATGLVKQILTFSRQTEQENQPLYMDLVVKEALKLLQSTLPANIEIIENIHKDLPTIIADPTQIHQVIMNLCINAGQAMQDQDGRLGVELRQVRLDKTDVAVYPDLTPGAYLQLTVSDTGPGINPEIKDLIFEPYFTTKKQGQGTGLGLAMVHSIVQNIGARISVYSEPGQGATFKLLFPAVIAKEDKKQHADEDELMQGKGHILFVDDEQPLLEIGQLILERLGYTAQTCSNSLQALKYFKSAPHSFDVLITDQTMPLLTGNDLAREVLRIRPDMPIILCTGYSQISCEQEAKQVGISYFLSKPILQKELAQILAKALNT